VKLSRRLFIFTGAGLGAGLGLGAFSLKILDDDLAGIAGLIRKQLPYAVISDADLQRFCTDYRTNIRHTRVPTSVSTLLQFNYFLLLPDDVRNRFPLSRRLRTLQEDILSSFIKSSDLLQACADGCAPGTTKSVRYQAFYSPYTQACNFKFQQGIS